MINKMMICKYNLYHYDIFKAKDHLMYKFLKNVFLLMSKNIL